jgi:hypothetical protein
MSDISTSGYLGKGQTVQVGNHAEQCGTLRWKCRKNKWRKTRRRKRWRRTEEEERSRRGGKGGRQERRRKRWRRAGEKERSRKGRGEKGGGGQEKRRGVAEEEAVVEKKKKKAPKRVYDHILLYVVAHASIKLKPNTTPNTINTQILLCLLTIKQ